MTTTYKMLECIHEIPEGLASTFANNDMAFPAFREEMARRSIERVIVAGLGSSFTAALIAKPLLALFPTLPVIVISPGDLHAYADRWINHQTLVVAVSRSGERGWMVDALKNAVGRGALGAAMTYNPDALLLEPADIQLLTGEGPELPFPKTKSVVACAGSLMQLGLDLADPADRQAAALRESLSQAPDLLRHLIAAAEPQVAALAEKIAEHQNMLSGGTVSAYGAALEFSLKLQETAQVPTSCWDSANLFHGPWGPHNERWLVTMTSTFADAELTRQSFRLAGDLRAPCLGVTTPGVDLAGTASYQIQVPMPEDPFLSGLFFLPVLQLLTYYWAVALDLNPDAPHQTMAVLGSIVPQGRSEPEIPV